MAIRVFDWDGSEVLDDPMGWLRARFGDIEIVPAVEEAGQYVYHATEFHVDADGPVPLVRDQPNRVPSDFNATQFLAPATFIARFVDENGNPLGQLPAAWYWPDAPLDGDSGPFGHDVGRCERIDTKADSGNMEASMGFGAYYFPNAGQKGPHWCWARGQATRSDIVKWIGMLGLTNHYHVNVKFQRTVSGGIPPTDEIKVYTVDGEEKDMGWARAMFGVQDIGYVPGVARYRLAELWATEGDPLTMWVQVHDIDGYVVPGINVALASRTFEGYRVDTVTDAEGIARFSMAGLSEHSAIDGQGNYVVGLPDDLCEAYNSAGPVMRVSPDRCLSLVYIWDDGAEVPPPEPPPPGDLLAIYEELEQARDLAAATVVRVDSALAALGDIINP
jgi:hypothetical protein